MNDLADLIDSASKHVQVDWTEDRERTVGRKMVLTRRRRARIRVAAAFSSVCVCVGLVVMGVPTLRGWGWMGADSGATVSDSLQFEDGSRISMLGGDSVVQTKVRSKSHVEVELVRGSARFQVTPDRGRAFQVLAGDVKVEVVGTEFAVERVDEKVKVSVYQGRVRVMWPEGTMLLDQGNSSVFPPEQAILKPPVEMHDAMVPSQAIASSPASSSEVRDNAVPNGSGSVSKVVPVVSWQLLAALDEFDKAYEAIERQGWDSIGGNPDELMRAADVARLSGHSHKALVPLRKLLQVSPGDPRAGLAAFTLGRVLLDELGKPSEAAAAFAKAQSYGGALGQDALAREVEALAKAGDTVRARERATLYVERYPKGSRLKSVQRHGGLE